MKFVTVRDFRTHSTKMWQQLKDEDEIVITLSGKPVALLTSLSEDTVEETLQFVRQAKAMAAYQCYCLCLDQSAWSASLISWIDNCEEDCAVL
jgi:antitoxin (DNA-binding transcriptional repressor) of toxin-antitoxin stability system